jgi:phosphoserine phosphatase
LADIGTIRLVVFDLDGTLTPVDSLWTYLHDTFGTASRGNEAARKYWNGQITYTEWAEADAKCWSGISLAQLEDALDKIPLRKGAKKLFRTLNDRRVNTVILSAGLSILADKAREELNADLAIANDLVTRDGRLTGEIKVNVSLTEKMSLVKRMATIFDLQCKQIALVGDRSNDLTIPECLRIAIYPKDIDTIRNADFVIDELIQILDVLDST